MEFIAGIIKLLSENKKFPAYQAERRIDIFINFFLKDILTNEVKKTEPDAEVEFVAPEYPLKKKKGNQSINVDYFCIKKVKQDIKEILLVELKTDSISFDEGQFKTYLNYKKKKSWNHSAEELIQIATSKGMKYPKRIKYYHLIKVFISKKLFRLMDAENILAEIDQIILKEAAALKKDKQKLKREFINKYKGLTIKLEYKDLNYPFIIFYIGPAGIANAKGFNPKKASLITFENLNAEKIKTHYPGIFSDIVSNLLD